MKKRIFAAVFAVVLCLLSGCGGEAQKESAPVRVGSLKGPTSMGLVKLMSDAENGEAGQDYQFTMAVAADEITAALLREELDIALLPANLAAVLYNKTEGELVALDINTLGVLYLLENGEAIESVQDLAGKTVYLPGKGTTPDYALQYLLAQNGVALDEVNLQYKSEGAEVIAAMLEDADGLGLLPQPATTAACMQNKKFRIALDLTEEWDKLETDSMLVTGVTVARRAFLEEQEEAVKLFLKEHGDSAVYVRENPAQAAKWIENLGIVPTAAIAEKAIPYCSITCLTGSEMERALSGYLAVLLEQNAASVGGALPEKNFYYLP